MHTELFEEERAWASSAKHICQAEQLEGSSFLKNYWLLQIDITTGKKYKF